MRGFVRRAAREVRDAGLSGIKGSSGVVKGSRCMQGCPGDEGLPVYAGAAPGGSEDLPRR